MKTGPDHCRNMLVVGVLALATPLMGCSKQTDSRSTPQAASDHKPAASGAQTETHMPTSSPNAASAPYDLQFIDTMISHHQGAVTMADMAAMKASRPELKTFALEIVADQNREISQMTTWREQWYPAAPPAVNMDFPGMMGSMHGMNMGHMNSMSGADFDRMFVDMMIPHHEGAIVMARDAIGRAEHSDLKSLSQEIIVKQQGEISRMSQWATEWK